MVTQKDVHDRKIIVNQHYFCRLRESSNEHCVMHLFRAILSHVIYLCRLNYDCYFNSLLSSSTRF